MRNGIKSFLIIILALQYSCKQPEGLKFKVSTNYLDGKSHLTKTKMIANPNSEINVYFFKKHFAQFYGLPNKLTNEKLKNQEITEWKFEDRPKELSENWSETFKYDPNGNLIEYKYSGCTFCSQFPWGYKLFYNKNNDIVEQQIYYLRQKNISEGNGLKLKFELQEVMDRKVMLTYDKNRNIVKLKKVGTNGLEELIELVE
ncbi:hypothetical protein [Flammeovirga aprica]|uniref:Uncharacterized protein n=1 Tax=Flammeovirga aprica JL-4 TaxID=694437 RepID=A0A7X9XB32_9BACT|nr:hypothetical protein [Flammeovirga aprica]NME70228.1 hypothetical protein [Flammeovirga aprica JL-4]